MKLRAGHVGCGCVTGIALAVACVAVGATDVSVTDAAFVNLTGYDTAQTNVVTAASVFVSEVPSEITSDKIAFHFDAKNRAGWLFNATDTTQITNIPSTVGTRYLSTRQGAGTSPSLGMGSYTGPRLAYSETFGDYVVDFGALNARRGLCFDPVDGTNVLRNIGTIVAVYDSEDSGGLLLGGGYAANGDNPSAFKGRNWCRANNTIYGNDNGTPHYASGMFDARVTPGKGNPWIRHDGIMAVAPKMGFNGGWEVFSYLPSATTYGYGLQANGIGINPYDVWTSSGMKIAEMYIFNCVLERAAVEKLEAHLEKKWFKRTVRGYNGDASVARLRQNSAYYTLPVTPVRVDVSEGTVLSADRILGGRGSQAKIVKTGAGTLKVGEMKGYGGTLVLEGGSVDLSRKEPVADAADLPHGLYAHFDANDAEGCPMVTEEADGKTTVSQWRSKVNVSFRGKPYVYARQSTAKYKPCLMTLANGKKVLDFGGFTGGTVRDGRYMAFAGATDDAPTAFAATSIDSASTVIALIGAQRSGGHFVSYGEGSGWARNDDAWLGDGSYKTALIVNGSSDKNGGLVPREEVKAYLDGSRADLTRGYDRPGYQVVVLNGLGSSLARLGGRASDRCGGFRLGELMIFNRHLSDAEVRKVSSYLEKRWFGCATPYYKAATDATPDVNRIAVKSPSALHVAEGSCKVAQLVADADVTKTGGGTLEIVSSGGSGRITVAGGAVKPVRGGDVASAAEVAAGPAFRMDPSDAGSLEYDIDGAGTVRIVHASDGRHTAHQLTQASQPSLDTTDTCNGRPVLDLGTSTKKSLVFSRPFDAVRSAYVVWKPLTTGACLLGNANEGGETGNTKCTEYVRGTDSNHGYFYNQFGYLGDADIRTNGVAISCSTVPAGAYQLVEVHTVTPTHVSAIGTNQDSTQGGAKYGEIILFERELTDREKVATRNYLMKKWFGKTDAELEPLPPAQAALPTLAGDLAYADETAWTVPVKSDGTADTLAVAGTMSFGRNVTLNLTGLGSFTAEQLRDLKIVVAHAGAYEGVENICITSDVTLPQSAAPRLVSRANGDLVVRFGKRRLVLVLR